MNAKDEIEKILKENCKFVDGQIKGLVIHGAIDKIVELMKSKASEAWDKAILRTIDRLTGMSMDDSSPDKETTLKNLGL